MSIYLKKISLEDKEIVEKLKKEIEDYDGNFEGFSILKTLDNYDEFYNRLVMNETPINVDYSPQFTYLAFNQDDYLIGVAVLRTELKGELFNYGGNVGYLVRPGERKKGYGSEILKESLILLKEKYNVNFVVLGCNKNNIGSSKVIINNGGKLIEEVIDPDNGELMQIYHINI